MTQEYKRTNRIPNTAHTHSTCKPCAKFDVHMPSCSLMCIFQSIKQIHHPSAPPIRPYPTIHPQAFSTLVTLGSRHTLASNTSPLATHRACKKSMYERAIAAKSSKLSTCSSHGANSFFCSSTAWRKRNGPRVCESEISGGARFRGRVLKFPHDSKIADTREKRDRRFLHKINLVFLP